MTEGIIQQVLNKWIDIAFSGQKDLAPMNTFELQEIKKELIERIKDNVSRFGCWQCYGSEDVKGVELEDLIGDGKE